MVPIQSRWIEGPSQSGRTQQLIAAFGQWQQAQLPGNGGLEPATALVLAANGDNRSALDDRLALAAGGNLPATVKTPLGVIADEVWLFWPLLCQRLQLPARFPIRLRPETEQALAAQLWRPALDRQALQQAGISELRAVCRLLDWLQLAGASGTPLAALGQRLELEGGSEAAQALGEQGPSLLLQWRQWCLARGLLTYGLAYALYSEQLLPDPDYRQQLAQRYGAVFADDADDYPAIARDLLEVLREAGAPLTATFNPDGQVRLGLGADPDCLAGLQAYCRREALPEPGDAEPERPAALKQSVVAAVRNPGSAQALPPAFCTLATTARASLLRQTAQAIAAAVHRGEAAPQDIAAIAPGLDAIGRYTLTAILRQQGIPVAPLNEQRPLNSSPPVRALLTLLALIYPGLGRLLDREAVAEMLVELSQQSGAAPPAALEAEPAPAPAIDPVRAGLLADHCYHPDPERPRLLAATAFPRWDRLGHRATRAYQGITDWIARASSEQPSVPAVLERAIQDFLWRDRPLPYERSAALRELMETAQHFWGVADRLGDASEATARFIQLLRQGAVAANPYPLRPVWGGQGAVTLTTVYQYRASRQVHRWHFWLDAGSPLWLQGGAAALAGAPQFLRASSGRPPTSEESAARDRQRLERILRDLLGRARERVYLCHSELAVSGAEQDGPLLPLVHAAAATDP